MRHPILTALLLLGLSGCALFQQVPGRATNGTVQTEAGAVWGKSTANPGGCPAIEFMGAQNVGEVSATCTGAGAAQSITAKSIDANSVLQTAIAGQTALGQQLSAVAQAALAALAAGGKTAATGGLGALGRVGPALRVPNAGLSGPTPDDCAALGRTFVITAAGTSCQ